MKTSRLQQILSAVLFLGSFQSVNATTVTYDVTNITGNTWEYSYTLANDSLGVDIEEFTVFFTLGDYQNLAVSSTPANWDPLAIDPDPGIPDDGFYDALALSAGIAPGSSLGGFSVQFDYLGQGTPGSQFFDIVDPITFTSLDSGTTVPSVIPVPAAIWLFSAGLLSLFGIGRSRIS